MRAYGGTDLKDFRGFFLWNLIFEVWIFQKSWFLSA